MTDHGVVQITCQLPEARTLEIDESIKKKNSGLSSLKYGGSDKNTSVEPDQGSKLKDALTSRASSNIQGKSPSQPDKNIDITSADMSDVGVDENVNRRPSVTF